MEDYYRELLKKYIANSTELHFARKFNVFASNLYRFEYDAQELDEIYEIIKELENELANNV